MKIIAIEREGRQASPEAFQPYLAFEALRLWDLYQAGKVRELYFRADKPEAVLILECDDIESAGNLLRTLPLVNAGLITFDLIPLKPYPGFARLFDSNFGRDGD